MSTIKALPSMEHTFSISTKGENTARTYDGTFTYKRPNLRTQLEISKDIARLNGDLANLDEDTKAINKVIATLKHTLIKYPEWWRESDLGLELYDSSVLLELYKTSQAFEKKWFEQVWGTPAEESSEAKK